MGLRKFVVREASPFSHPCAIERFAGAFGHAKELVRRSWDGDGSFSLMVGASKGRVSSELSLIHHRPPDQGISRSAAENFHFSHRHEVLMAAMRILAPLIMSSSPATPPPSVANTYRRKAYYLMKSPLSPFALRVLRHEVCRKSTNSSCVSHQLALRVRLCMCA